MTLTSGYSPANEETLQTELVEENSLSKIG